MSDTLYQECKAFNINVVVFAPGAIKSNIADSAMKAGLNVPETSFYRPYLDSIVTRILSSQGSNSMPAETMAQKVVPATLSPRPPRYFSVGGFSLVYAIFAWLPKTWVLNLLWRKFKGTPKRA